MEKGYWDAIHVVEVRPTAVSAQYRYKLTSTVMLYLSTSASSGGGRGSGALNNGASSSPSSRSLAGSVTRQMEQVANAAAGVASQTGGGGLGGDRSGEEQSQRFISSLSHDHVVSVGRMIEEMEAKLRSSLDDVYFKKTREVVEHVRASDDVMRAETRQGLMAGLMNEMVLKKENI